MEKRRLFRGRKRYGGYFMRDSNLKYVGGECAQFLDIDPDLMSYFEIVHELRRIKNGSRVVNNDEAVMQMFDIHREQGTILIYIGDLDNLDYAANVQSNFAPNNTIVECLGSNIEESFYDSHEKGLDDASDGSDSTCMVWSDESDSEHDSDFDFFLDGDDLTDDHNTLGEENVVNTELVGVSQLDMEEYSNMTNDEYVEYMGLKHSGKIVELECMSDDECLEAAYDLDIEHSLDKFPDVETYKRAYQHIIMPIPEQMHWLKTTNEKVVPPPIKRLPDRPKKQKKKSLGEPNKRKRTRDQDEFVRTTTPAVVTTTNVPQEVENILNKETRKGEGGIQVTDEEKMGNSSSGRNCKERGNFTGVRNGRGRGYGGEKKGSQWSIMWVSWSQVSSSNDPSRTQILTFIHVPTLKWTRPQTITASVPRSNFLAQFRFKEAQPDLVMSNMAVLVFWVLKTVVDYFVLVKEMCSTFAEL
ncbi:hypothetical protein M9H77_27120 [Catharanthus roseus]|uniref:Uncharacterized protein n=1 Tax=Catharanthus roseus TaxID=4058 RepID=A0ACC0AD18_CATRO|nr:hypothetical protein M9H77_27120 [Catharanthus roseus]